MALTVSLAQFDIVFGDVAANVAQVVALAGEAAASNCDLLVLPELWSTGYDLENAHAHAEQTERVWAEISTLAKQHDMHIVGSCLALDGNEEDGVRNRMTWHGRTGDLLATYDKLHLFRLMDEHKYLTAGDSPTNIDIDSDADIKAGLSICYDLRFPELFRHYALNGATMMIIPAEWPHPRLMHWRTLLRARAIENQCFVIACNRVGTVGETRFFGHSVIIDPWGETVIEGDETAALLTATIDVGDVTAIRKKIPVFQDRREIQRIQGK